MTYFDGIKVGDKVWGFGIGWSVVQDIITVNDGFGKTKLLLVSTDTGSMFFNFEGFECDENGNWKNNFQSLFWSEVKFEVPKKLEVELKENKFLICLNDNYVDNDEEFKDARIGDFSVENGLLRDDKETAERALEQIRKFTKLLALRDQECPNSRGYKFNYSYPNFIIYKNYSYSDPKYEVGSMDTYTEEPTVYFKTEEDAQRICDLLNSGRFSLEEG